MDLKALDRAKAARVMAAAAFLAMPLGQASAATQGTLGATSSGSVLITASVPNRARISGLADITFANQDPTVAAAKNEDVCVWSNTTTKAYTITATGSGASSAFTLTNGTTTVPYAVEWGATSGLTSGTSLVAGAASTSLTSGASNQSCSTAPLATASLIVKMSTTDLGTMSAGANYTGTLTLLVTPQ